MGSLAAAAGLTLAACSSAGGGGDIGAPPSEVVGAADSVDPGPDFVPTPNGSIADGTDATDGTDAADGSDATDGTDGPMTTEFDLAAQPTTPPIDPIPETGVPGIDSSDAFCRAWSEFAGSFQALGLTSAIGDAANAYRLEVIAASSVTVAVEMMETNLPAELESERVALITDFAGPFFTRAMLAESELEAAGLDPDSLRDLWLATLSEAGVDDPFISVDVTADIGTAAFDTAAFDAAVASFSAAQPGIVDDPSLVTDASIPLTEAYLAESCPDGGTLSGNDDIDS